MRIRIIPDSRLFLSLYYSKFPRSLNANRHNLWVIILTKGNSIAAWIDLGYELPDQGSNLLLLLVCADENTWIIISGDHL